ncbi:hypothetical protein IP76_00380 [Rhizobium sp. AAP43]|nr:hypothetical protein IP76_00380 [Rhizobium sp. AAP43]
MAAITQKIRARQELTDAEKVMARQGLAAHARKKASVAPSVSAKRGDGINRAAIWRKAMASQDEASLEEIDNTDRKTAGTHTNMVRSGGSHADMWRRAHERARAMPPIHCDE